MPTPVFLSSWSFLTAFWPMHDIHVLEDVVLDGDDAVVALLRSVEELPASLQVLPWRFNTLNVGDLSLLEGLCHSQRTFAIYYTSPNSKALVPVIMRGTGP